MLLPAHRARFLAIVFFLAALVLGAAPDAASQTPEVTLSVPANTEFAEGDGNTTVTVTATLSASRSVETVVDLNLGGTAKSTDYGIVGSLPDITIPAEQTVGTADVTLSPVDDNFFEGDETIGIGGAATGLTVNGVDVPLVDNEQPPTLTLELWTDDRNPGEFRKLVLGHSFREGAELNLRIVVLLNGGAIFEENKTVSVKHDDQVTSPTSLADINLGDNGLPWSIEIPAEASSAILESVSLTIVDDPDTEPHERFRLKAEVSAAGTNISAIAGFGIAESDEPLRFYPHRHNIYLFPGQSRVISTTVQAGDDQKSTRDYTIKYTADDASLIDPDSIEFEIKSGHNIATQDITFVAGTPQDGKRTRVTYTGTIVPNDGGENAYGFTVNIYPSADSSYQIDELIPRDFSKPGTIRFTNQNIIVAVFEFPRPMEITGPAQMEIILDSGVKTVPCRSQVGPLELRCEFAVAEGDYDFDGKIEIPAGAVKFTGWRDVRDPTVTGTVASPLPATKMSVPVNYRIYGGSHAVDLRVSPQTLQEGVGEQMLEVTARYALGQTLADDLVIPLTFTDLSTSKSDYSIRGTPSVTIPAGAVEGSAIVHFTPVDDLVKEARVETVRIEGSKGAMMTPFVRGAELRLLDAAGIRLSASPETVAEDGGAQQVTVTAEWGDAGDSALARDVEVALTWGGTAGSGDYARSGGATVTIPANARSGSTTVTITPTDDKLLEGDETIQVHGSAPGRAVAETEITLTDDETVPAVSIAVDTNAVQEGGSAQTVTVSATLDPDVAMANDVTTVTLGLGGTATGGGTDYTSSWSPSTPEITIPVNATEGSNTVSLTLTPVDDQSAEGDETIVVQGTATTQSRSLVVKVATIALEDDDEPGVNVSPGTLTVAEGATGTYEVWLGTRPASDVTVSLSSTDGTVATVNKSELTFTPTTWDTRQEVTLTGEEDDRNNADDRRTATIRHTAGGGGYDDVEAAEVSVIVTDNDEAVSFSIADAAAAEGEAVTFTVTRNGATGEAASVEWKTAADEDGSHPASSADYTAQATAQTLSFAAGDTEKTFTVQTTGDSLDEEDETFLVKLSEPSAGASISDDTAIGRITDDDDEPELRVDAPRVTEGDTGTATLTFTVTLSAASGRDVTVDYADAASGTAVSGTDYTAIAAGKLTFAAGETGKTVAVSVTGDADDEANETVILRLSSPSNAVFSGAAATLDGTGAITDDDATTVTLAGGGTVREDGTDSADVTVSLGRDLVGGEEVTVSLSITGTGIAPSDYIIDLKPGSSLNKGVSLETGNPYSAAVPAVVFTGHDTNTVQVATLRVKAQQDRLDEGASEALTVGFGSVTSNLDRADPSTAGAGGTTTSGTATVTVTDDDDAGVTIAETGDPAATEVSEDGKTVTDTYTIVLDSEPAHAVTVMVSAAAGVKVNKSGGTAGSSQTLTFNPSGTTDLWSSPQTVTVTGVDDDIDNADDARTVAIGHAASSTDPDYVIANAGSVDVTVTDDDTKGVTVSAASAGLTIRETDDAGTSEATENVGTYTVVLTSQPTDDVVIDLSVPAGAPFMASPSSLTFTPSGAGLWSTAQEVTVTAVDDNVDNTGNQRNASITHSLTVGSSDYSGVSVPAVTVTVTDDDAAPTALTLTVDADTGTQNIQDSLAEGGGAKTVRVTATLDGSTTFAVDRTVTVEVGDADDSATEGTDYAMVATQSITIRAGASSGHADFTLTPTDDAVDEENETISLDGTLAGVTVTDAVITLADDDTKGVTVSAASAGLTVRETDDAGTSEATENVGTYTVVLTSQPTDDVVVDLSVPAGAPFMASPSSLTFTDTTWNTAQEVTVTAVDDNVDNTGNQRGASITHSLTVGSSDYGGVSVPAVTVTVTDDDAAPTALTLTVDADTGTQNIQDSLAEGGGAKTVRVTATLDGSTTFAVDRTVTVEVGDADDSATEGTDYAMVATQSITIRAGASSGHADFTLTPTDDAVDEENETISLDGSLAGVTVMGAAITLTDDDTKGVTVSASAGLTIRETDDGGTTEATENVGTYTVVLTSQPTGDVVIDVSVPDGAPFTASPSRLTFTASGAGIWSSPQEVSVTAVDDNVDNTGDMRSAAISHEVDADDTDYEDETASDVTVTVTDDDAAPTALTLTVDADTGTGNVQTSVSEGGGAKTVRVTATLDGSTTFATDKTVTVEVGNADDGATEGADYAMVGTQTVMIKAGASSGHADFTLTPTNDVIDEENETISLDGTLAGVTVTDAVITLTDDDDAPGGIALSVDTDSNRADSQTEVGEAAGAATVTVTATVTGGTTYSGAQTVAVSVSGNTATVTDDFAAVTGFNITIPAGTASARGMFTLTPVADAIDEDDETVAVTGTVSGDGAPAVTGATVTIKDDDEKGVTVSAASAGLTVRETDDGGTTQDEEHKGSYTIVLDSEPTGAVVVNISVPAGAPFTVSPPSLTFNPSGSGLWSNPRTVTVTATDDNIDNAGGQRTAEIAHTLTAGSSDYQGVSVPGVDVTVTDDDGAPGGIALSVDTDSSEDGSQTEVGEAAGATTVTVTATVTGGTTYGVAQTVAVTVSGGTATVADDFAAVSGFNITIPAGATARAGTFSLTPVNDLIHEGNESIDVTGAVSGAGAPTVSAAAVTITDDDAAPTGLTLTVDADTDTPAAQTSLSEGGGAKTVRVTATLDGSTTFAEDKTVAVEVGRTGDSAAEGAGGDYGTVARQDIEIRAGTSSGHVDFTLTPVNDFLFEGDETISIDGTLAGVTVTDAVITLADDETLPAVTLLVDPDAVSESGGTRTVTVSATLDPTVAMANDTTTVTLSLGGTATGGTDYTLSWSPSTPVITFPVGETEGANTVTLTLTPTDDSSAEGDETVVIQGAATTQSRSLVVKVAVITLEDDDAPGVNLSPRSLTVTEGATATYDVWLGTQPSQDVTVTLSGLDATMATADSGSLTFTQTNWNIRQQVTVSGTEDDLDNAGDKRATSIRHSAAGGGYDNVDDAVLNVTVADNDDAPSFSIGNASAAEGDAVSFTVSRDGARGAAATVSWHTADDGDGSHPASAGDYTAQATAQVLNFDAGDTSKTVTVQTTEDLLHEEDETFLVKLSAPSAGASIDDGTAIGTITDDDDAPTTATLTVDADTGTGNVQTSLAEDGGAKTVRVTATLDGSTTFTADKTVTVEVGDAGDSATEGTDYGTVGTQTVTIKAGTSSGHVDFTLTPTQDTLAEGGETISFKGTAAGLTVADATITLTDDDSAPTTATLTVDADTGTGNVQTSLAEDGGAKTVRVTATLDGSTTFTADKTVTVEVGDAGDSATEGTDYGTVGTQTVTIKAGTSSGHVDFTLTPTQDTLAEGGETISFKGTAAGLTVADATITLTDDDSAPTTATLTVDADTGTGNVQTSLAEDGGAKTVRVTATLDGSTTFTADKTVTVEVGDAGDSATEGTDYGTVGTQTVTIKAGTSSGHVDFTLTPTQDTLAEGGETISFKGTAAGLTVADATITLTDDDSAPTTATLTVDADTGTGNVQTSLAEDGGAKTVRVTATLGGTVTFTEDKTVTVEVGDAGDSATEGTDYGMVATQTITITAGASSGHVDFTLTPTQDTLAEGGETISFKGTAAGLTVADATITLTDDDSAPTTATLSVDADTGTGNVQTSLAEDGGAKTVRVTATLDGSTTFTADKTVTVEVGDAGDSATEGTDYGTVGTQTVTIKAGTSSGHVDFTLTPTQDTLAEGGETISFKGTAAGLTVADATITLTDDDSAPTTATLTVDADTGTGNVQTSLAEDGGAKTVRVTATLDGSTTFTADKTVTVEVGDAGDSATEGTDYGMVATQTITITAGASSGHVDFTLTPTQDTLAEGGETISFKGAAPGLTVADATITLTDDDDAPSFSIANASATEGDAITFTVTRAGATGSAASVKWNTVDDTDGSHPASGADYTRQTTAQVLSFAAGDAEKTFTVQTTEDSLVEENETFLVELSEPSAGASISRGTATGTITDDETSGPVVTVSGGPGVTEGAPAVFTVSASPAPATALTVNLDVTDAAGSDFLAAGSEGEKTVIIPMGKSSAELTLATVDDGDHETDGVVTATVGNGAGYAPGNPSRATVAVSDDDLVIPVVSIAGGSAITEGGAARFTLTATPAPPDSITINVNIVDSGDFVAGGQEGARTVAIGEGGSAVLTVTTVNDAVDEPDGTIQASVTTGDRYTLAAGAGSTATVPVSDDDAAPAFSVDDATAQESDGVIRFTLRLRGASVHDVRVSYRTRESDPVSARENVDYLARDGQMTFRPGETEKRIEIGLREDSYQEDDETFEIALSDVRNATIADGVGVGTITNDDPMPAAWLARFGRMVAEQALDGISERMAASRTAGVRGAIAGQALNFDPGSQSKAANDNNPGSQSGSGLPAPSNFGASADRFGAGGSGHRGLLFGRGSAQSRTMTAREAILGSSFTLTGEEDSRGGSLAFWGRAAQSFFNGGEGALSLDGEATTAMLGADYARDKWLLGMALMQSSGEGGYADVGGGSVRESDGKVEASLTAAIPYAALQASERLKLYWALGHGTGDVSLKPETGGALKADISWSMAAMGMRGELLAPSLEGPALALVSDALWARTSSDRTQDLAASDSDVTRLRLGLEGRWHVALSGSSSGAEGAGMTPRLEVGMRHDGGDAETGFGVELGGGLAWSNPALGLSLDLEGRTLVAHGSDDLEDRGFAASLAFDPEPASARGLSLSLRQDWGGQAAGGLDALFTPDPLGERGGDATTRWHAEAAYGFPALGGRFTGSPHVDLGLATGARERDYSLGWRLTPAANGNAPDVSFGVTATRRESDTAPPEHTLGVEATARW